ncbi:MAG TPA: nicotinate-nucleotide adenylyltransferase [Kiritimatiellia bacterium]|nr:nicotinate-nucleotide adenylyltransferase [Kiritimatiellia bacterium]
MSERIGIFGGSFNPVHLGHLIVAQDALEHMGLTRLVFLPAAQPPHKPAAPLAAASHRLEMLRLATADDPRFEVSDDEVTRGGVSYTVDTLRRFRERYPAATLYFLIGGDSLLELHTWREVGTVLQLAEIVTVVRPGASMDRLDATVLRLPDPWPARLTANLVAGHRIDISSTDIRNRVNRKRPIRYLVPDAVARYIAAHQLYSSQEIPR